MKHILLKNGQQTQVDDQDYNQLVGHNWFYAEGYAAMCEDGLVYKMQNVILCPPPGFIVDHRNRKTLDNQRHNLRLATIAQNQWNGGFWSHNSSGFKGVIKVGDHGNKCWRAVIKQYGKRITLGYFYTAEDAARAYDKAAIELRGEFASTNEMLGRFKKESEDLLVSVVNEWLEQEKRKAALI